MGPPIFGGHVATVVITGGSGFLGSRLARELLAAGSIDVAGSGERRIDRLNLIDRAPVPADLTADARVTVTGGDLTDLLDPAPDRHSAHAASDALAEADVIFHLAAASAASASPTSTSGCTRTCWPPNGCWPSAARRAICRLSYSPAQLPCSAGRRTTRCPLLWTTARCQSRSQATARRRSSSSTC